MSQLHLRQIIGRQPEAQALVASLAATLGAAVTVEDAHGRVLHGDAAAAGAPRFPVTSGGTSLGWVAGHGQAAMIARLLDHLVAKEVERRALGTEILHLYREVNLIYSFSEKLAALLDVERVARLTLDEARHLIAATDGAILLIDHPGENGGETLGAVASFGDEMSMLPSYQKTQGILGAIASSGVAEIVNDVELDPRRVIRDTKMRALIAAPLKVGERVLGVIALGSTGTTSYTAAELKLLNTLALQTATAIENARLFERAIHAAHERERLLALNKEAEIARAKLEGELDLAARIQAGLFPAILPSVAGYDIAARNRPARRCGGDYYDVLEAAAGVSGGRLLLCVADVAGKGLPAALVMANMQATLRALLGRTESLTELAEEASRLLYASTTPEKYVTAAFAELELASGAISFVSAGHVDNVILRANGDAVKMSSTGRPLGLLPPGLPFTHSSHCLEPGDLLVLFSDGVTDAVDESDDEFGEERLLDVLRRTAGDPLVDIVSRAIEAIDRFAGGAPQFDDITMLVVRRSA
jgi:serine phosphatase RsbU (regulator of sigma subunit)